MIEIPAPSFEAHARVPTPTSPMPGAGRLDAHNMGSIGQPRTYYWTHGATAKAPTVEGTLA